jgi:hypothetical protein
LAPARAGAIPIPDKIEAIFIRNWNYSFVAVARSRGRLSIFKVKILYPDIFGVSVWA